MKPILVGAVVGLTVSAFVHSFINNTALAFFISVGISILMVYLYFKNNQNPNQ